MFKVIVAGSRSFKDYDLLRSKLDHVLSTKVEHNVPIAIVSGTASGADRLGERYAKERGYHIIKRPAQWDLHGRKAGYLRNVEMAELADACVVFWDGKSAGTYHMINISHTHNLPTKVYKF